MSADSCEATSPSDSFNGSVATSGSVPVTVATAGSYNYTLVCQGISGPAIETLTITVRDDLVSISSFSASPNPVEAGQETTLSWETLNADSCTATAPYDEFNGPVDTNGTVRMTIATVGSFDFTLTCQGFSGPVMETLTIIVEESDSDSDCDTPLSGTTRLWSEFWGVDFPGPIYQNTETSILRSGYLAVQFDTGDIVDDGLLVTVATTKTSGTRLGAVSECPGNFDVKPECDHRWGIGGGITWATNGKDDACQLKPNTTYYFNVTFTDGFDPSSTTCSPQGFTSHCVAVLQVVNR